MILDTHELIEELMDTGVKKKTAEVWVRGINKAKDDLVTKSDLKLLESKLSSDIKEIKTDIKWIRWLVVSIILLHLKQLLF